MTAVGTENQRVVLTTAGDVSVSARNINFPDVRLVDGPSILAGRVQIRHNGKWRSVCTNSKNWTTFDMETACRQLGFQGGSFHLWYNRQMPLKPRLLYEEPKCMGTEGSLFNCQWATRQMGSGVCDYHPDLGLECQPMHDKPLPFWRGLKFEQALNTKRLTLDDTLYTPESMSRLEWVNIYYAGSGRDLQSTSSIDVLGVAPRLDHVEVFGSAYNGINITNPEAPVNINNCRIRNNRGYGIFINSSYGLAQIEGCTIMENGADGVRFVRAEERPDERADRYGYNDFCQLALASHQTFPLQLYAEQPLFLKEVSCNKVFKTRYGHVLTLHFIRAVTDRNASATLEVYDGSTLNHRRLTSFPIRNNTRPQSITSIGNQMYIKFRADPITETVIFLRLVSGLRRSFDLNVSNSDISENSGRGVAIDNLRSQIHVYKSSISKNEHVAGVHVTSGVGEVNVTESRISFNEGDGVNVTYTGGSRNISRSSISSNQGYGVAIWLNDTLETEYLFVNQTSVVQYSEIYKNLDIGVLHGNYCGDALFNFTENSFKNCLSDALEVLSCWRKTDALTKLQIGHNRFLGNERISLKISPAVNLQANVEYNHFRQGSFGGLLIKNKPLEEFNVLKSDILVQQNYFINNTGTYVVNLGLSPYAEDQYLLFTRNFLKSNKITEPFQMEDGTTTNLNPRSRVAAPVVVGSNNIDIFRNIIENPDSKYEIGSHLGDQSRIINCTYNWLGFGNDENIFHRIFHRYDRYNLAKVAFIPFLLHNTNPLTSRINTNQFYVPKFSSGTSDKVGGEIEGEETIPRGEYIVTRDITIRPGGKLTIDPGVTLRFPPSIGMMVGGRLDARGIQPDSIRFTLKEELPHSPDNVTAYEIETEKYDSETEIVDLEPKVPIRLLGGNAETEGRLQVKINERWGTVCNYGWTMMNAALVCQQMGYVLNPDDWYLERNEIPSAGTTEPVILSNVQCDTHDLDVTRCRAETVNDFENSCDHNSDVGLRCYKTSWAGVRFSSLAERTDVQFITIERSGLLDYATSAFKPALQLDFARQNFENIKVTNNNYHGLGVMYSDIYSESVNVIKNSEFSNNRGAGVSLKQLGLTLYNSKIENNFVGIEHNPTLSALQQREVAGWFIKNEDENYYDPFLVPHYSDQNVIEMLRGETKYLVTEKVIGDSIVRSYKIRCEPGWSLGIQLLNPIENRSTESITIIDALTNAINTARFVLKRDLTVFPTTSSSHGIILEYVSGANAFGGTVLVLNTVKAPIQNVYNRIVKGPVPTLSVSRTVIRNNAFGMHASYYNRYLDELGNHFLRKANESTKFLNCEISHNLNEAVFVHSPNWDLHRSNISEIKFMFNRTLIVDNGKGVYQFSRDMRASNNLFHYVFQDNTIERNKGGGFDVALPYVWQYNENFTHSVYMDNNTYVNNRNFEINIDGHFAIVNITNNVFKENKCRTGLLATKGMEKKMLITGNKFTDNNGQFIVLFSSSSQSEIIGSVPAVFRYNELRNNKYFSLARGGVLQLDRTPTSVIAFRGIQKVGVNRNLMSDNALEYQLIAGIKTGKINNFLDVKENWWGSALESEIGARIFDFDDWNDHAIADFRPYLLQDDFQASYSVSFSSNTTIDLDHLGGRIYEDFTLVDRGRPYIVQSDVTVMPNVTLTIHPGVVIEFAPNIGILVLGTLNARGYVQNDIIMRPISSMASLIQQTPSEDSNLKKRRELEMLYGQEAIRLCKTSSCVDDSDESNSIEGFLEYFNSTTLQWIPMCDSRFTERNAQVVCRELGFDPLRAFFDFGVRIDFHSNSLSRIWTWPEPLQCAGTETRYEDCPIRLNGQQFGHRHRCEWNSQFVFIHCDRNIGRHKYWGGIRFAGAEFEQQSYNNHIHDIHTHTTIQPQESTLEYVKIYGAGILHNEKSSAVQSVIKSPRINFVEVNNTAFHAIDLISPAKSINLLHNTVQNTLGVAINVLSLSGEGMLSDESVVSEESSFTPLRGLNIPYSIFSLLDICDTDKEINVQERILVHYKYDNHPVNCVKIFRSVYNVKLGLRLLQFHLFNSTVKYGIPDFLQVYDGDIYNVTSKIIDTVTMTSGNEKKLFRSTLPSLSLKLFANGASSDHGFIAEIVTSATGFNRDVQHNMSNSVINNNGDSALLYMAAGEVNPIVTIEKNQFRNNCRKLYGNFTTCKAAISMDVQNTRTIIFRSNLIEQNQGGLYIKADSSGSATSLRGWIHNNLFVNNSNLPTLHVEGWKSSHYQEVTVYKNYFTRNFAQYHNNIVLRQVVSNFTYNYVKRNVGLQNLEISGFDRMRFKNVYQTTTHNGFYNNFAVWRDSRSTVVAGTAGQHYVDNIFFNPDNDYEMITINRSLTLLGPYYPWNPNYQPWDTRIDAANNYWGVNTSLAVRGRIKDKSDDYRLLEVTYEPFYMNNRSILNGKCPPGWELVGETCYMYVGAPLTFWEAKAFCQSDNASMPYLLGNINYLPLYNFLRNQDQWYQFSEKVWVQHIDKINECTIFAYQTVEVEDCSKRSSFICEIDPKVSIHILPLADDIVTISVISSLALAILLIILVVACWWSKSKYRQAQRLERRNSIRQSLHSLRSVGLSNGSFADPGYRKRANQLSTRSTDTLTKKMITNGSIDSMEKSAYSSSIDDNQSYEVYEAHNPNPQSSFSYNPTIEYHKSPARYETQYKPPTFDLAYKNEGFRDTSTFATNSNYQSRAESVQDDSTEESPIMNTGSEGVSYPPSEYYNNDTLPLRSDKSDSTLDLKRDDSSHLLDRPNYNLVQELKRKMPQKPPTPPRKYSPTYSEHLEAMTYTPDYNTVGLAHSNSYDPGVLETDFDEPLAAPRTRAKSEVLLETNFDFAPSESAAFGHPLTDLSRSKSQPLETAM